MEAMKRLIFIAYFILFSGLPVFAEVILLKNGKTIEAKITEKTDSYIKVDLGGVSLSYLSSEVAAIDGKELAAPSIQIDPRTLFSEAQSLALQQKYAAAKERFKKLQELKKSDLHVEEALAVLEALEKGALDKEYADLFFQGIAFMLKNQLEQAIILFGQAIQLKADFKAAFCETGFALLALHKHDNAAEYFRQALKLDPQDSCGYLGLATVYNYQQRPREAILNAAKAVKLNPDSFEACIELGRSYGIAGQPKEGIIYLKKAAELNPGNAEAYFLLGRTYDAMSLNERAIFYYEKALEIKSEYPAAFLGLANIYSLTGQKQKAIDYLKRALEISPQNAKAYNQLAGIYLDLGQYQQAIQNAQKTIAIEPQFAQAYLTVGQAYKNLGQYSQAKANLKVAQKLYLQKQDAVMANNVAAIIQALP